MTKKTFTLSDSLPWAGVVAVCLACAIISLVADVATVGRVIVLATSGAGLALTVAHFWLRWREVTRWNGLLKVFGGYVAFDQKSKIGIDYDFADGYALKGSLSSILGLYEIMQYASGGTLTIVDGPLYVRDSKGREIRANGYTDRNDVWVTTDVQNGGSIYDTIAHEFGHVALNAEGIDPGELGENHHRIMLERGFGYC